VDPHSIKVVNIKDFAVMVRNGELGRQRPEPPASNSSRSAGGSQRQLSLEEDDLNDDGEDEENVFARVNVVQDHALMRKTYEALAAVVPRSGTSTLHVETVCGAVCLILPLTFTLTLTLTLTLTNRCVASSSAPTLLVGVSSRMTVFAPSVAALGCRTC